MLLLFTHHRRPLIHLMMFFTETTINLLVLTKTPLNYTKLGL